jgi:hypothetical protein
MGGRVTARLFSRDGRMTAFLSAIGHRKGDVVLYSIYSYREAVGYGVLTQTLEVRL